MYRILYLAPGPSPPIKEKARNQFFHLSKYFHGDILSPMWGKKVKSNEKEIQDIEVACGRFRFYPTYSTNIYGLIKVFWDLIFFVYMAINLKINSGSYDAVISYGPFKTGLAGYFIKILIKAPLIVEVPGNPIKSFSYDQEKINILRRIKIFISSKLAKFVINRADHIKLLYPSQLDNFCKLDRKKVSIFFDFVPINKLRNNEKETEKFILFLGYPWYLKGVDILIKAFNTISSEFPEYKLKIVGYCSNKDFFSRLVEGNSRIELKNPVFYKEAMHLMGKCTIFILPSRTEAMGRVLLEAMACKKPIIASRVDGIPYYVSDGFNGLLFESENVEQLAGLMRKLISNPELAAKIAENGYIAAKEKFKENRYVEYYTKMVKNIVK